jgi:GNAT superfamily N-acetyltransferase
MSNEGVAAAYVRRAAVSDAAEIARLAAQFGYTVPEPDVRRRLEALGTMPSQYIAVVQDSRDSIGGWIQAQRTLVLTAGERVEIIGLVVDAATRRRGIGALLVEAAQQWTRTQGLAQIIVRSNVQRDSSHLFYLALGYCRSKTQHVYGKTLLD